MNDTYFFPICMAINFTVGLAWLIFAIKVKESISGDFFAGWLTCTLMGPLVTIFCGVILGMFCIVALISWASETLADEINRKIK